MLPTPKDLTLDEIQSRFGTDEAARAYLEEIRWPNGIVCPHCKNLIELVRFTPEEILCPSCGSSFRLEGSSTTSQAPHAGQKIGKFEIMETVGVGAFGTVYKARDPELDRIAGAVLGELERSNVVGRPISSQELHGLLEAAY